MRVFFAVEFDDDTKRYITRVQDIIKENSEKGNFSHEENFHLTVRFIGEVDFSEIERLKKALDEAVANIKAFKFNLGKLGFFTKGSSKILWLGIYNRDNMLNHLKISLENSLAVYGYEKETRSFSPHITLSRNTILNKDLEKDLKSIDIAAKEVNVNKISLMESKRVDGKLVYVPIYVKEIQ